MNLNSINPDTASTSVHNAKYDKKMTGTTTNNDNSTDDKVCYRCGETFTKRHQSKCKAIDAECNFCDKQGTSQNVARRLESSQKKGTRKKILQTRKFMYLQTTMMRMDSWSMDSICKN